VEAEAAAQRFIRTLGPAELVASADQALMAARIRRGADLADELYGERRS
jgi:hypothetical protein